MFNPVLICGVELQYLTPHHQPQSEVQMSVNDEAVQ